MTTPCVFFEEWHLLLWVFSETKDQSDLFSVHCFFGGMGASVLSFIARNGDVGLVGHGGRSGECCCLDLSVLP